MAGHSKWKNIMYRKGAQDAKRAKQFTKVGREIAVAARQGLPDPEHNPRLRAAIQKARQESMPREKIENAIKRGTGEAQGETPGSAVERIEAGPGVMVRTQNQTASGDDRAAFADLVARDIDP